VLSVTDRIGERCRCARYLIGDVDNIDREFVNWPGTNTHHDEIETCFVVSPATIDRGTKDEVAIRRLEIEDQGSAITDSAAMGQNLDRD